MDKLARLMERNGIDSLRRPTTEERLDTLETTTDDIILLMADLIGGM